MGQLAALCNKWGKTKNIKQQLFLTTFHYLQPFFEIVDAKPDTLFETLPLGDDVKAMITKQKRKSLLFFAALLTGCDVLQQVSGAYAMT